MKRMENRMWQRSGSGRVSFGIFESPTCDRNAGWDGIIIAEVKKRDNRKGAETQRGEYSRKYAKNAKRRKIYNKEFLPFATLASLRETSSSLCDPGIFA